MEVVMKKLFAVVFVIALSTLSAKAQDQDRDRGRDGNRIRHVLLISVDGMHEVDLLNCGKGLGGVNEGSPYCPNLAELANHAVNYVSASTSKPSDSFPGLMAIVSGASPRTMGIYYDVSYDRSLDAPAK